jgi:hypothetical protein
MSPYTQNVMQTQQALMAQQQAQNLNQINTGAAQAGAYGGDRQAVADQLSQSQYAQNLAAMQAGALQNAYGQGQNTFLQSQGQGLQSQMANQQAGLQGQLANQQAYNTAAQYGAGLGAQGQLANQQYGLQGQLANQSTNLQGQSLNNQYGLQGQGLAAQYGLAGMQTGLQSANQLGQLAPSQQQMGLNWINAMNQVGGTQQQQQQNLLNQAYNNYGLGQNWGWQQLGNMGNLLHGVPVTPSYTQTNLTAAPSTTGMLSGLGTLATGLASGSPSDRRLKKAIRKVREVVPGVHLYVFQYRWEKVDRLGYMSDEIRQVFPEAVVPGPMGYDAVRYDMLPPVGV